MVGEKKRNRQRRSREMFRYYKRNGRRNQRIFENRKGLENHGIRTHNNYTHYNKKERVIFSSLY